ncbi:MAG: hypothetical protein DHS20C01_02130 [marine bacterium B5-7]|nr:MAG: hypothetical protein DHS20C01_02130 [marine bacterium B5-7]
MDLVIRADGKWYYQGTVFKRQRLVNLLAKVLICEDDQYYLVSPSEKLRITVEDAPFIATDFECSVTDDSQLIIFGTNVNQKVQLDDKHPLWMAIPPNGDTEIPYIRVRDQLVARLTRSVFYRLTDLGCEHSNNGKQVFGIESAGTFFELGAVSW